MSNAVEATPPAALPRVPPSNRARGQRLFQSAALMFAVTTCCVLMGLLATRYPVWVDATSTRSHRLSPRTLDALAKLRGATELVVTVNSAAIDGRSAERTRDVLDTLGRASDKLTVTIVDVASASGAASLDGVWQRIGTRYADELRKHQTIIAALATHEAELGLQLGRLSGLFADAETSVGEGEKNAEAMKRFLGDAALFCRLGAKDIADALEKSRELVKTPIGRSPVPSFDSETVALRQPLATIGAQLSQTAQTLEAAAKASDEQLPTSVRDRLKPLSAEVNAVRDRLARVEAGMGDLPRMPLVNVARVLERSSAVLVIGPPPEAGVAGAGRDLAAVDIDALFPARNAGSDVPQTRIDMRAKTEEVIGSAIASLVNPAPPILILLHGEDARFAPDFARFVEVFERLRLRGIDVVEWPVWIDKDLPSLTKINPKGDRPVVFATIYTIPSTPQDAARYVTLARTVEQLASAGKPMLISLNPSTMPAIGQPDAMAEFLGPMGLKVDTGRPLLHQVSTPSNPVATAETFLTASGGEHPISRAINGLRVRLPWAMALHPQQGAGAAVTPLLGVEADGKTWGESQWIEFRSVPLNQRAFIRSQDQPRPDSQRDDAQGPWVVGAAVERKLTEPAKTQRLVVIGSNGWFLDEVAESAQLVDNRRSLVNPGNTELFEASIYWLAGQDAAIGASPQAEAAPVIPALSAGTVGAIRWALIAGLPMLILLVGAVWRLVKG